MKAAYFENGQVLTGEFPDPIPGKGQALVRTHRCGLCASDQHFLKAGNGAIALSRQYGGAYGALDWSRPFVPGHEFVGELLDYGPGSRRPIRVGSKVTSVPIMRQAGVRAAVGYSHECPGGFGELMLLDEDIMMALPSGFDDDLAAMIEPLAVGLEHARMGRPEKGDVALVLGCGAIGLSTIAGLRLLGVSPIVAADFHPARREEAIRMGAHVAIDPRETSPYAAIPDVGMPANLIYECVGKPGMLQETIAGAPFGGRIVMGGYCMEEERVLVFSAQNKRLNVQFASGEEQQDMDLAMRAIDDGLIDVKPWIGARIGRSGLAQAIAGMGDPAAPVRVIMDPRLD